MLIVALSVVKVLEKLYFFLPAANQQVDAIHVTQLERDTVLVCLDRKYSLCSSASTKIFTSSFHLLQM